LAAFKQGKSNSNTGIRFFKHIESMCEYKDKEDAKKANKFKRHDFRKKKCDDDPYNPKRANLPTLKQ